MCTRSDADPLGKAGDGGAVLVQGRVGCRGALGAPLGSGGSSQSCSVGGGILMASHPPGLQGHMSCSSFWGRL